MTPEEIAVELERRTLDNWGNIMGLEILLTALFISHPEKEKLQGVLAKLEKAADQLINREVLMMDNVSPYAAKAFDAMHGVLEKFKRL